MKIDIVSAWYNDAPWLKVLRPVSMLYGKVAAQRKRRLQHNQLAFPVPVVVVGNITVGGTGKTPVVLALAAELNSQGYSPVIISRGYGGQLDPSFLPHAVTTAADPILVGDEPAMMAARNICPVIIDPNRPQAALYAVQHFDCDVIISDDGLQHYALPRAYEIAVVDGERGVGNGRLLPEGPLREPTQRLDDVDCVLVNGDTSHERFAHRPSFSLRPTAMVNVASGERIALNEWQMEEDDIAIAAIGNPSRFKTTLMANGIECELISFDDHHPFQASDLPPEGRVIMTEKDAIKCRAFAEQRFWYLAVDAVLPQTLIGGLSTVLSTFK